jgi:hypothetical protein
MKRSKRRDDPRPMVRAVRLRRRNADRQRQDGTRLPLDHDLFLCIISAEPLVYVADWVLRL